MQEQAHPPFQLDFSVDPGQWMAIVRQARHAVEKVCAQIPGTEAWIEQEPGLGQVEQGSQLRRQLAGAGAAPCGADGFVASSPALPSK